MDNWVCSVTWFVIVYVLVYYYKYREKNVWHLNKYVGLLIAVVIYVALVVMKWYLIRHQMTESSSYLLLHIWLWDFKSLPCFLMAVLIFHFFQNLHMRDSTVINWWATSAFSVYIIHQTPTFIPILWKNILHTDIWVFSDSFMWMILLVVVGIYVVSTIVDKIRTRYLEPLYLESRLAKGIEMVVAKYISPD